MVSIVLYSTGIPGPAKRLELEVDHTKMSELIVISASAVNNQNKYGILIVHVQMK